jgi:hypothetical protein
VRGLLLLSLRFRYFPRDFENKRFNSISFFTVLDIVSFPYETGKFIVLYALTFRILNVMMEDMGS